MHTWSKYICLSKFLAKLEEMNSVDWHACNVPGSVRFLKQREIIFMCIIVIVVIKTLRILSLAHLQQDRGTLKGGLLVNADPIPISLKRP